MLIRLEVIIISSFLGRLIIEFASGILVLPVIQKAGGKIVSPGKLGRFGGSVEELFHDFSFELTGKGS